MWISVTIIVGLHFYYIEPEHNYNDLMITKIIMLVFFIFHKVKIMYLFNSPSLVKLLFWLII